MTADTPPIIRSGLALISAYYGVPAKRGARVRLGHGFGHRAGREGVITQSVSGAMHLHVRLDGDKHSGVYHPTWELEYL